MAAAADPFTERILILAPIGRDAVATASLLHDSGLSCLVCSDFHELERALEEGAGTVLVTEEAFARFPYSNLLSWVDRQPPWSDIPVILLTSSRGVSRLSRSQGLITGLRNTSLLERPVQAITLLSAIESCLRARRRQYEMRGYLLEREHTAAELERLVAERTRELEEANARLRIEMAEREQAEAALRQTQKMEAIGQMTGGIAHDFNNLLTAVLGNIELASRKVADERIQQLLSGAAQAAERGAKLTHQLLAFSRKQQLRLEPVDLNQLVSNMGDLLFRTIGTTIRIDMVLQEEIWPAVVDPTQVELVILNLALNARDAMPSGGRLTVTTMNVGTGRTSAPHDDLPRGDFVSISVSDTGTGMTEEVLARAFEPFFTTKTLGAGTGLGLSQVYGVARQSGGTVRIESRLGHGTTVWVYFPRAKAQVAPQPAEQMDLPQGDRQGAILVVDDDRDVRRFVVTVLAELGYTVTEASSAREALDLMARGAPIDVALVDYAMPDMNGRDLVTALRLRHSAPRHILFMTGYAANIEDFSSRPDSAAVLRKPFTAVELASAVERLLSSSALRRGAEVIPLKPSR
jgi:signal transduction histidine kinase/CheY-like chemotaxis protein